MDNIITSALYISLMLHILIMGAALWRVWKGENVVDRLIGFDLLSTLVLAVLVICALIFSESIYIDIALGLAFLGFVGSIALAKYIADEKIF